MTTRTKENIRGVVMMITPIIIFIVTVVYVMGGQSRTIDFNTQRIKRIEHTMEKRFDRVEHYLMRIMKNKER